LATGFGLTAGCLVGLAAGIAPGVAGGLTGTWMTAVSSTLLRSPGSGSRMSGSRTAGGSSFVAGT
jgi:hypothetical protein